MKVYLVRHGLSEGNIARTYQSADTGLSQKGVTQAKAMADRVSKLKIDLIYSSDLARAKKTADEIAAKTGIKTETWDEIREITRPSELRGKHVDSPESQKFEKALRENYQDPNWKYSDDESFNDLNSRARRVLEHLETNHQDQNVLIVSHGTFIKILIASVLFGKNLTPSIFVDFRHHTYAENTGVSVLEYSKQKGWKLLTFSDSSHL